MRSERKVSRAFLTAKSINSNLADKEPKRNAYRHLYHTKPERERTKILGAGSLRTRVRLDKSTVETESRLKDHQKLV